MKIDRPSLRLARLVAATGLTVTSVGLNLPAMAQDAADPPWRVGRLAQITGSVSTHGAGGTDWADATINLPLTSGNAVWTQPGSGASIQVADNLVALNGSTELDLATLDNHQFIATEPQGELFLDLRDVPSGDSYTITTPRGTVQLGGAGQYGIIAGDSAQPTSISVISGSARVVSGTFSLDITQGQTATITGSDTLQGSIGPLVRDAFLDAHVRRPAPRPVGPPSVRYMPGGESLDEYGSWQASPDYGQVWYPRVQSSWAPYREGSWAYVAPWGWTWVDDEPWGFAPFHYGRWSQFNGRWGWVPSERQATENVYEQPTYAPALVDFVVVGAVAGAVGGLIAGGFGGHGNEGRDRGDIGWIPLGPHEQYRPQFNASQSYVSQVNYGRDNHNVSIETGSNNRTVNNTTIINNYANRSALTVIPASAMARSERVGPVARTGAAALGDSARGAGNAGHGGATPEFQPVRGTFPVRPAVDTRGVTPAVVQHLGLTTGAPRPSAPGPTINPQLFAPHRLPADRTPFRGQTDAAAGRPGANPAAVVTPSKVPDAARPPIAGPATQPARVNELPALRAPGATPPGTSTGHPFAGHPVPVAPSQAAHPTALAGPALEGVGNGPRHDMHAARPNAAPPGMVPVGAPHPEVRQAAPPMGAVRPQPPRASPEPVQHMQPPRVEARPAQHHEEPHPQAPHPAPQRPEPRAAQHEPPHSQPAPHPEPRQAAPAHPAADPHRDDHHHP